MPRGIYKRKTTTKTKTMPKPPSLAPTNKWIVGMIDHDTARNNAVLKMHTVPRVWTDYAQAVAYAERACTQYGKSFVVFAKKAVIDRVNAPVTKTEYLA